MDSRNIARSILPEVYSCSSPLMAFLNNFINELTFVLNDMGISLVVRKKNNNMTASGAEAFTKRRCLEVPNLEYEEHRRYDLESGNGSRSLLSRKLSKMVV